MRNLINVINEMLSVIPSKEKDLIRTLEDIQDSQRFRAPEDMIGWWQISDELDKFEFNKKTPLWILQMCSIFSTQDLEEIKKEVYGC